MSYKDDDDLFGLLEKYNISEEDKKTIEDILQDIRDCTSDCMKE